MIKLRKNQKAMFHTHELNEEEIDYIITKLNAINFINKREEYLNKCYDENDKNEYEFVQKEFRIIESLKNKLDIWEK